MVRMDKVYAKGNEDEHWLRREGMKPFPIGYLLSLDMEIIRKLCFDTKWPVFFKCDISNDENY